MGWPWSEMKDTLPPSYLHVSVQWLCPFMTQSPRIHHGYIPPHPPNHDWEKLKNTTSVQMPFSVTQDLGRKNSYGWDLSTYL